ncbi:MAG TPA: LysE family translocator [Gaiellaceae bacterium]|nr:LysE family translocator [Gaiellaceae bacterium]
MESLAAFALVSVLVICTPGQDTALTIRNTLRGERRHGVATAGGVALGQAVWTLAASAGVVAVLSASDVGFRALKLAGAAYLVYLGAQSLLSALRGRAHAEDVADASRNCGHGTALRQGLISNLGNPKMAVFFASLLPQFAPGGGGSFAVLLALGFLFCAMTFAWLTLYAVAIDRLRRFLAGHVRRVVDALAGTVLVAFGARLASESR